MRPPVLPLAVGLAATVLVVAACTPPGPPDRALHRRTGDPRFLTVSNQALAPLAVGSASGLWITTDVGRTWRAARPAVRNAMAIGYTNSRVYVSRGQHYEVRDPSLRRQLVFARRWPFGGSVTAMASDPRHNRMWALARNGDGQELRYTNDGGRLWWSVTGSGLCIHPRSLAASSEPGRMGHVRLFAACREGLFASDDLGYTFHRLTSAPSNVRDVATSAFDSGTVVIASPNVRVSRDQGASFSSKGLSARLVAVDPRNPSLIFAIALNGRLYASADGGDHF
jgi:photosystem II stability/assembly factor-like uncharacterized protein